MPYCSSLQCWQTQNCRLHQIQFEKVDKDADITQDISLALESFAQAFSHATQQELETHFGSTRDIRQFYLNHLKEYDIPQFRDGQLMWIRAKLNDSLVGWMTLSPNYETQVTYVSALAVSPHHQRLGIGEQLLRHIKSSEVIPQTREITLWVRNINARAIRFYFRLGFVKDDERSIEFLDWLRWQL